MTLTTDEFQYVSTFVTGRSSIVLAEGKEYLVEARLTTLTRQEGLESISNLVEQLRRNPNGPLGQAVVEAMTTNETSFFRDIRPFDALRLGILPDLIERRRAFKSLNIWSAASSTGQEAYSIAIMLREHFPELTGWRVKILGTDLSTEVLAKAKSGVYSQLEVGRGLPTPLMMKYFDRNGSSFEVKPELKAMVEFRPLNLTESLMSVGRPDVVFLRNVLIYFDIGVREAILRNVATQMADDGWLVLGAGETIINLDVPYERFDIERTSCLRTISPRLRTATATAAATRPKSTSGV